MIPLYIFAHNSCVQHSARNPVSEGRWAVGGGWWVVGEQGAFFGVCSAWACFSWLLLFLDFFNLLLQLFIPLLRLLSLLSLLFQLSTSSSVYTSSSLFLLFASLPLLFRLTESLEAHLPVVGLYLGGCCRRPFLGGERRLGLHAGMRGETPA
ncbi:hypothetical protein B0I37DRAFT_78423 [Chaetomium sp. MPI-CAGE-AT-0009]|nr:hypothetical protein B0I37DRAFT_78423 [Chaetomium sp. MPI-CAGE-AT-0009]